MVARAYTPRSNLNFRYRPNNIQSNPYNTLCRAKPPTDWTSAAWVKNYLSLTTNILYHIIAIII